MFDIKALIDDTQGITALMQKRGKPFNAKELLDAYDCRRKLQTEIDDLRASQNKVSKEFGTLKKSGGDTSDVSKEIAHLSARATELEPALKKAEATLANLLQNTPNIPHADVPDGRSEEDNVEVRRVGDRPAFDFAPRAHYEIGEEAGLFSQQVGVKLAGSRFVAFTGHGARLVRALISFMLDTHAARGYFEVAAPYIANRASMTATGQLPDKEADMFHISDSEYFLNPTAEVPLTNLYRDEILDEARLPINICGYAPSFRREAGAAGRDTRGLIRLHQFDKVELVKFVNPDDSYRHLEELTGHAEAILQVLGLHYRVVTLCGGDLGFAGAKTYDIEVWMPGANKFVEISSCTNFEAFQARRAGIRFKAAGSKPAFVHTLNGSALAVGRTVAAICENYQQADGCVAVPDVLRPYMGGITHLSPPR